MATITTPPITVFASAAYTATQTSTTIRSGLASGEGHTKGLAVVIDCTVDPASASVVFTLDVATGGGSFSTIATSTAVIAANSTTTLIVHPDIANDRANVVDQGPMATRWQVVATHVDGDSITYSVIAFPLQ